MNVLKVRSDFFSEILGISKIIQYSKTRNKIKCIFFCMPNNGVRISPLFFCDFFSLSAIVNDLTFFVPCPQFQAISLIFSAFYSNWCQFIPPLHRFRRSRDFAFHSPISETFFLVYGNANGEGCWRGVGQGVAVHMGEREAGSFPPIGWPYFFFGMSQYFPAPAYLLFYSLLCSREDTLAALA